MTQELQELQTFFFSVACEPTPPEINENLKVKQPKGSKPSRASAQTNPPQFPVSPIPHSPSTQTASNMSFEENFDAMVYGSTQATEDPEVQKVFELELALPDLTFVEILGDIKAQGAAGFADQLMQDNTPTTSIPQNPQTNIHEEAADHQEPSSLPRTISMEMDTLKSEEHQSLPVEHHPRSEIQSEANVKFQCAGEMQILEPEFATSQYVFKRKSRFLIMIHKFDEFIYFIDAGKRPFYEIKGKKVVQLKVSPEPLDQQWIFTGLFHSHPEYCHLPIWAPSKDDSLYSPNTPFNVHGIDPEKVVHLETQVQDMNFNLKIKGVLILLTHDNIINLEYLVNSTDKNSKLSCHFFSNVKICFNFATLFST